MHKRTAIGAAAFSVALAGGAAAGALLGTPGVSGAQDDSTTTTAPADGSEPARRDHPVAAHRGDRLAAAAEALGMTQDELAAELREGRSIAQVAEEREVDLDTVVDALVAEGTEQLEAAIEALPERVAELVQREGLGHPHGDGHGPGRRGGPGWKDGPPTDDAAEADDGAAS